MVYIMRNSIGAALFMPCLITKGARWKKYQQLPKTCRRQWRSNGMDVLKQYIWMSMVVPVRMLHIHVTILVFSEVRHFLHESRSQKCWTCLTPS